MLQSAVMHSRENSTVHVHVCVTVIEPTQSLSCGKDLSSLLVLELGGW